MFGSIRFHAVGTAGGPAEFDKLTGGTKRCRFTLAVNEPKKVGDKWEETTTWITCALFGNDAERPSLKLIRRGEPVYVEGKVASYPVEIPTDNGVRIITQYTFRPDIVRPMGSRPQEARQTPAPADSAPAKPPAAAEPPKAPTQTCRACGAKSQDPLADRWGAPDLCGACTKTHLANEAAKAAAAVPPTECDTDETPEDDPGLPDPDALPPDDLPGDLPDAFS